MGETGETLEPQDQRGQGPFVYQVLKLQARECETEAKKEKRTHEYRACYG